jgi:hypothetical protein
VDALRKAVALGFAGLYVRESEGGTGLGRSQRPFSYRSWRPLAIDDREVMKAHEGQ